MNRLPQTETDGLRIMALCKGAERYVFIFVESRQDEMISTLSRMVADPELSFTWYDAAVLAQRLREEI